MVVIDGVTNPKTITREKLMSLLDEDSKQIEGMIQAEFPGDFTLSFDDDMGEDDPSFYTHTRDEKTLTVNLFGDNSQSNVEIGCDVSFDGGGFGFGVV